MKRLLILLLLIALPTQSWGFMGVHVAGGGIPVAGAACTTSNDSDLVDHHTATADDAARNLSNVAWAGSKIVLSDNSTITEYLIRSYAEGSRTGNCSCELYTHNSGSDIPDSAVADSIVTRDLATGFETSAMDDELFTLATPLAVSAGTYWVVCKGNASGMLRWAYDSSFGGGRYALSADGGSTWGTTYDGRTFRQITRGCD